MTVRGVRYVHKARGLTVVQVCTITGASAPTVRSWIVRKHLRRNEWGRIEPEELARYLAERGTVGQHKTARRHGFRPGSCAWSGDVQR